MDSIIKNSLEHSMTYGEYRDLMKQLVGEGSTTGQKKLEELIEFTKVNESRMKRWDKTIKISEELKDKIMAVQEKVTWLVITESWCGDAAHVVPAINKVAELNDNIDLKLVLRDENLELMDAFLTDGGRSIPKLIMLDNATGEVLNTFGPRPTEATNYVTRFKAKYGAITPEFKEDLQHWYNKDKGQNVITDLTEMLNKLESKVCQ